MNWPRKVFLESTALFQLGSKLQKPEFAKLAERREYLDFSLLVSEVSWAEYVRQRRDKIDTLTGDLRSIGDRLSEWEQSPEKIRATHLELSQFRNNVSKMYEERANEAGIQILGLPPIDVGRLLRMSIERKAPFEESRENKTEKGFRDALIMFTILENIKERPKDFCLVVTNDSLLTKGLIGCAAEYKTELTVVPNLDDAITHIDARVDAWYRDKLFEESEEAKAVLDKYEKEIAEQVSQIRELTDLDLGVTSFSGLLGGPRVLEVGESLEQINSLKPDKIESAVWKDKDKPRSRVLFRIRCTADVTTSFSQSRLFIPSEAKYTVGGEKQPFSTFLDAFSPKQLRARTIPVLLYGEAHFERTNGDWKFVNLRVDRSQPDRKDVADLVRVRPRTA